LLYCDSFSFNNLFSLYVFFKSILSVKISVTNLTGVCTALCAHPTVSLTNCSAVVNPPRSLKEYPMRKTKIIIPIKRMNDLLLRKNDMTYTPAYSMVGCEDTFGWERKCGMYSKDLPVPIATLSNGSSVTNTGIFVSLFITSSMFFKSDPPPDNTIPRSIISATNSGGVFSKVVFTEFTIDRSEEHTSELQSRFDLVCRLLLEKKKQHIGRSPVSIQFTFITCLW